MVPPIVNMQNVSKRSTNMLGMDSRESVQQSVSKRIGRSRQLAQSNEYIVADQESNEPMSTVQAELTLEDFDSNALNLRKIPKTASTTCRGQILIRPVVEPVLYTGPSRGFEKQTIDEFGLTEQELNRGSN